MRIRIILSCMIAASFLGSGCQLGDPGGGADTEASELPSAEGSPELGTKEAPSAVPLAPVETSASFRSELRARRGAVAAPRGSAPAGARTQGVKLSAQQSTSAYHFIAEVGCCYETHDWYLQYPTGEIRSLGSTELYGTTITFTLPLTAPSGGYKVLLDAYIYDTINQRLLYFDLESPFANVPLLVGTPDVGVIPGPGGCGPSAEVMLHMDNEDHNEASSVSGWVGKDYVDGNGNTKFYFCRVSGYSFASLRSGSSATTNYAVLQLGASCPPGSIPFGRYFDNEDDHNLNSWSGNISPNTNLGDTWLRFCMFKGDGFVASGLPSLGFEYGVLAGASFGFADAWGSIFTDDEDDRNRNSYDIDATWATTAQAIVSAGGNTLLRTARRAIPACGDGRCNGLETASSCRQDCGRCGDGVCFGSETAYNCAADCGGCGDGICGISERFTCLADCPPTSCGIASLSPDGSEPSEGILPPCE